MLRSIMSVGTASDVGKSIIAAGFCRVFLQDGYRPLKAQNMSLNSYATPEGLEIDRVQAVQAKATGVLCYVDMNPVLLKPTSDQAAQVVVNGRFVGMQSAYEYFCTTDRHALFEAATQAYDRLAARYSPVVREGAGSISELNLKARDIFVEEEDSVALFRKQRDPGAPGRVQVAVVLLGRMSNFTDFDTLGHDPRAHLFYTHGRGRNPGRANRGVPRHGPPAS